MRGCFLDATTRDTGGRFVYRRVRGGEGDGVRGCFVFDLACVVVACSHDRVRERR